MSQHRYYARDGQPIEMSEWLRLADDPDYQTVLKTTVGDADVSTVWLGMDHGFPDGPPMIFETMIFGGPRDEVMHRYSTEEEARAGHYKIVIVAARAARSRVFSAWTRTGFQPNPDTTPIKLGDGELITDPERARALGLTADAARIEAWRDPLLVENARLREALEVIRQHAQLDLDERGVREAERYVAIARSALNQGEKP